MLSGRPAWEGNEDGGEDGFTENAAYLQLNWN